MERPAEQVKSAASSFLVCPAAASINFHKFTQADLKRTAAANKTAAPKKARAFRLKIPVFMKSSSIKTQKYVFQQLPPPVCCIYPFSQVYASRLEAASRASNAASSFPVQLPTSLLARLPQKNLKRTADQAKSAASGFPIQPPMSLLARFPQAALKRTAEQVKSSASSFPIRSR